MSVLIESLRVMDSKQFELLVLSLLKRRYPTIEIKRVRGDAGDQGVDMYCGSLDKHPTIWQCKAFPSGVKETQKNQIRESFRQAIRHHAPYRWVLCVSSDLDIQSMKWFERFTRSNAHLTEVRLEQGSDLVRHLLYEHTIREHYFPQATLNTRLIREGLAGTDNLNTLELSQLNERNIDSYLARLQEHDARFAYSVTTARDTSPPPKPDNALFAATYGSTTIAAIPRDHGAINDNPPLAHLVLTATGYAKLLDNEHTGQGHELVAPMDIVSVATHFDFLTPKPRSGTFALTLSASAPRLTIPMRLTFGTSNPIIYEYVEFTRTRAGTKESCFVSDNRLPFGITFVIRDDGTGNVSFKTQNIGHDVRAVQRFLQAIQSTDEGIEFYDLNAGKRFRTFTAPPELPPDFAAYKALIDDAVSVAQAYDVSLTSPGKVTSADVRAIESLIQLRAGTVVRGNTFTMTLTKSTEANSRALLPLLANYRIVTALAADKVIVFNQEVPLTNICYDIPQATFDDPDTIQEFLKEAPAGSTMKIQLTATRPITAKKLSEDELQREWQQK